MELKQIIFAAIIVAIIAAAAKVARGRKSKSPKVTTQPGAGSDAAGSGNDDGKPPIRPH